MESSYLGLREQRLRIAGYVGWTFGSVPFQSRRAAAGDLPHDAPVPRPPPPPRQGLRDSVS